MLIKRPEERGRVEYPHAVRVEVIIIITNIALTLCGSTDEVDLWIYIQEPSIPTM